MVMKSRSLSLMSGSLLGLLAVVLGAYGSHGLPEDMPPELIDSYSVGVRYQFVHALLLLIIGYLPRENTVPFRIPFTFFTGVVLFSGSIYILVTVEGTSYLGPVTPIGGVIIIAGWIQLLILQVRQSLS